MFGGEFDWIASDDEATEEAAVSESFIAGPAPKSKRSSVDQEYSLFLPANEGEDFTNAFDYGMSYRVTVASLKCADELLEPKVSSDPYAGIFFSKDRTEKIIEVAEEDEWVELSHPYGDREGAQASPMVVRVMSVGDWMKGCPEGSEYSRGHRPDCALI